MGFLPNGNFVDIAGPFHQREGLIRLTDRFSIRERGGSLPLPGYSECVAIYMGPSHGCSPTLSLLNSSLKLESRRYMAETLPIRRKTQTINQSNTGKSDSLLTNSGSATACTFLSYNIIWFNVLKKIKHIISTWKSYLALHCAVIKLHGRGN